MGRSTSIINVDDIGIYDEAAESAIETITDGAAQSGSVMTICPGTKHPLETLAPRTSRSASSSP